jgi:hypothetical protein
MYMHEKINKYIHIYSINVCTHESMYRYILNWRYNRPHAEAAMIELHVI